MYRMSMMALLIPDSMEIEGNVCTVNKSKCIKMSIVHDLAECIAGDITPYDGISKDEKFKREKNALEYLVEKLGEDIDSSSINDIKSLWMEYEENTSVESIVVHDLDKLEMIIQAQEYEQRHSKPLNSFFESTKDIFRTNFAKKIDEQIRSSRPTH